MLEARIPSGPIEQKWDNCRYEMKLVNPANRRKHSIIVVGTGLAGAAAAACGAEAGAGPFCNAASISALTMRPFGPLPFRPERSMPACLAIRRASGEAKMRSPLSWPLAPG